MKSYFTTLLLSLATFAATKGQNLQKLSDELTSIHFIGDLHADVECAKQWVTKTNLVNITSSPFEWLGDPEKDAIVFLGDYVDKGSASASVLKFVRELQETFPNNIVTMLGNHDVFLVLDTALSFSEENPHPLTHPFYDYAYSFMHPEEYIESEWVQDRDDDEEILGEILLALSYIYDRRLEGSMHLCAPNCSADQVDLFEKIPPFDTDVKMRERAIERLDTWRKEYAQGLFDSGLLKWMTQQPIVAIVGDALTVHGGVSDRLLQYVANTAQQEGKSLEEILYRDTNARWTSFFQEELEKVKGANQIEARLTGGFALELIMDMIQHRGYFDQQKGCQEVDFIIKNMHFNEDKATTKVPDLNRIVVGHTPHNQAFEACNGKLLASDSSLSRSFRAHGNMYCPLRKSLDDYRGTGTCLKSYVDKCEGSISRITRKSFSDPWPNHFKTFQFHENDVDEREESHQKSSTNDEL